MCQVSAESRLADADGVGVVRLAPGDVADAGLAVAPITGIGASVAWISPTVTGVTAAITWIRTAIAGIAATITGVGWTTAVAWISGAATITRVRGLVDRTAAIRIGRGLIDTTTATTAGTVVPDAHVTPVGAASRCHREGCQSCKKDLLLHKFGVLQGEDSARIVPRAALDARGALR